MQVFDYAGDSDAPDAHAPPAAEVSLLPFKERFLPRDHPGRPAMARVSARLRRAGWDETNVGHGLTPAVLAAAGVVNNLTRAAANRSPRRPAAADRGKPA